MLSVEDTAIPAVKIVTPKRFGDHRGFFSETWSRKAFAEAGLDLDFVQDNQSLSAPVGTLRGLHFQSPPFAQDKLVRVTTTENSDGTFNVYIGNGQQLVVGSQVLQRGRDDHRDR